MITIHDETHDYYCALDILESTIELIAGNEDYLVIHVDRNAYNDVRAARAEMDRAKGRAKQ